MYPTSLMQQQFLPYGFPGASVLQVSQMSASRIQGRSVLHGMISSSVAVLAYQLNLRLVYWATLVQSPRCFIRADMQPWEPVLLSFLEAWKQKTQTSRAQMLRLGGTVTVKLRDTLCWCREMVLLRSTGLNLTTSGLFALQQSASWTFRSIICSISQIKILVYTSLFWESLGSALVAPGTAETVEAAEAADIGGAKEGGAVDGGEVVGTEVVTVFSLSTAAATDEGEDEDDVVLIPALVIAAARSGGIEED